MKYIIAQIPIRHSELVSESPHYSKPFGNEQEREEMLKRVQHDGLCGVGISHSLRENKKRMLLEGTYNDVHAYVHNIRLLKISIIVFLTG